MKLGFSMVSHNGGIRFGVSIRYSWLCIQGERRERSFCILGLTCEVSQSCLCRFQRGSLGFSCTVLPFGGRVSWRGEKSSLGEFRRFWREDPPGHTS